MTRGQRIFKIKTQLEGHDSLKLKTHEELTICATLIKIYIDDDYVPTYKTMAHTSLVRLGLNEIEADTVLTNICFHWQFKFNRRLK